MKIYEIEINGKVYEVEAATPQACGGGAQAMAGRAGTPANLSGQPAGSAPIPAPQGPATPLPDVPEQYRAPPVENQDLIPGMAPRVRHTVGGDLQPQIDEMPWHEQAVAGIGVAPAQATQSIKQLTGLGKVSEADVKAQRAISNTGWGMAGNIAGNIGMLALPLGKAEKALRGVLRGPSLLKKALGFGVVPAVAAAEAAALRPTIEGEDRGEEALKSAAMAGVLGSALKGGLRVLGPGAAKMSKLGHQLEKQHLNPTVGQASKGFVGGVLGAGEDLMRIIGIRTQTDRVGQEVVQEAGKEVTDMLRLFLPKSKEITASVSRNSGFFRDVPRGFDASYDKILENKVISLPRVFRESATEKALLAMPGATDEMQNVFRKKAAQIFSSSKGAQSGREWRDVLNLFREERRNLTATDLPSKNLIAGYKAIERSFIDRAAAKGALSKSDISALKEIDLAYSKYLVLEEAADIAGGISSTTPVANPGMRDITARNLVDAVQSVSPRKLKVQEAAHFQRLTGPMSAVLERQRLGGTAARQIGYGLGSSLGLGSVAATAGITPAAGVAAGLLVASAAGTTKTGAKLLMGRTEAQRVMAKTIRKTIYPKLGTLAASFDTDE